MLFCVKFEKVILYFRYFYIEQKLQYLLGPAASSNQYKNKDKKTNKITSARVEQIIVFIYIGKLPCNQQTTLKPLIPMQQNIHQFAALV